MFRACYRPARPQGAARSAPPRYGRPVSSLTREAARTRANLLTVDEYDVSLDLTTGERHFDSTTRIRFRSRQPGAATFVDVAAHDLRSATLNGRPLDLATAYDAARRRLRLDDVGSENE